MNKGNILSSYEDEGVLFLKGQDNEALVKGRKADPLGTKKTFGDKEYLKTASGWKAIGKNSGKAKDAHDFVHGKTEDKNISKIVNISLDTYKEKIKNDNTYHEKMVTSLKGFIENAKTHKKGISMMDNEGKEITLSNENYIKAMEIVLEKIDKK